MIRLFVKLLPSTLRARLLIYLIEECSACGEIEPVSFSCRFMMPFSSSIEKIRRRRLSLLCWNRSNFQLDLRAVESL